MEGCLQFGSFLGSPLAAVAEEVQSFKVLRTSAALLRERTEEEKEMLDGFGKSKSSNLANFVS